jgi:hypothetical protein
MPKTYIVYRKSERLLNSLSVKERRYISIECFHIFSLNSFRRNEGIHDNYFARLDVRIMLTYKNIVDNFELRVSRANFETLSRSLSLVDSSINIANTVYRISHYSLKCNFLIQQ